MRGDDSKTDTRRKESKRAEMGSQGEYGYQAADFSPFISLVFFGAAEVIWDPRGKKQWNKNNALRITEGKEENACLVILEKILMVQYDLI